MQKSQERLRATINKHTQKLKKKKRKRRKKKKAKKANREG